MSKPPVALLANDLQIADLVEWIEKIPFTEWPQQSHTELRPAMVTDQAWHGFSERTGGLVRYLLDAVTSLVPGNHVAVNRWLSVVMPSHEIEPHRDAAEPGWLCKVHVPLLTNPCALMIADGVPYHLAVGSAYFFNKTALHAVRNDGETPRVHFMFEVLSAA